MPETLEPPAQPRVETPSATMDAFDQTFSDLETPAAVPAPGPTPSPESVPAPTERPKDPTTGKFVPKTEKPVEVPKPVTPEVPKTPKKPATPTSGEFEPPQVAKPSELRNWAKRMGTRAEQAEQGLSKLNHRIRELESKPSQSGDVTALTQELASAKKRLDEYEGELKVTRYERSGEYKDKYEKPYRNALQNAYNEVGELLVTVANPNDPEQPLERQATGQDFDEVYNLPLGPATKLAKQKFGDAASIVIQHVKAIKDARRNALTAIDEQKGKAVEFEQAQTAQQKLQEEGRSRMFGEAVQAITEKYKDLFGERDGDTTWNQALAKGRHMADLAFSDRQGLTPAQSAILDAQIHARVSAFPGLRAENDKLKADLAAKDKEISELRGSGPGKPGAASMEAKNGTENLTLDQAFDKAIPN